MLGQCNPDDVLQTLADTVVPELERRREQERYRGLLRVIVRAWREEADGRHARSLRVAVPKGVLVEEGGPAGRLATDCLSTAHSTCEPRVPRAVRGDAAAEACLRAETVVRERVCEGGSGLLPVSRSAVPAGTLARLLLVYARLVEGGRLRRRRLEGVRPERRVQGRLIPAGRPAEEAWQARVARVRQRAEQEGVEVPVMGGEVVAARYVRRRARAVGLQGGEVAGAEGTPGNGYGGSGVREVACGCPGCERGDGCVDAGAGVGSHLVPGGGVDGGGGGGGAGGGGAGGGGEGGRGEGGGGAGGGGEGEGGAGGGGEGGCGAGGGGAGGGCEGGDGEGGGGDGGDGQGGGGAGGGGTDGGGASRGGGAGSGGGSDLREGRTEAVWAFAGWGEGGRELPYRRLQSEGGVVRPRALRARARTVQCGVHVGGGQGVGGACAPASGGGASLVRRLELPLLRAGGGGGVGDARGGAWAGGACEGGAEGAGPWAPGGVGCRQRRWGVHAPEGAEHRCGGENGLFLVTLIQVPCRVPNSNTKPVLDVSRESLQL